MPPTPLFRPAEFFEERDSGGPLAPAVVVWVSTVLLVGSVALTTDLGLGATPLQLVAGVAVAGAVAGLIEWAFVTVLVYVASVLLGGEGGGFGATFAALGWGHLPMAVGGVVDVTTAVLFSETTITATEPFVDLRSLLFGLVGVGFILWQGYVWFGAVRQVRGLGARRAALAVAIPVAIPILAWLV